MDDKQLNFNQPLLSVRRGSSTAKPDVERRKTDKPSPRIRPPPFYKSDLKSGPIRNPGVVPFKWEQIPGRPKNERKIQNNARLPHVENFTDRSSTKNDAELERSENVREENGSSVSEGEKSNYVDAVDSLSRNESFLNCSLSGVSGLDGTNRKPNEISSDPVARDLMMDRFLPAAKAVASENPHSGSKKQPREVKKVMASDKQKIYYYAPISFPQNPQPEEEEEDTEDDEEEEDYNIDFSGKGNVSVKLCGLLPRFCLLNPIPGIRDQVPRQIHKKPANARAFNKTDKAIRDAVYERRRLAVYKKSDMRVDANRLKHELNELYPQIDSMRLKEALKCSSSGRSDMIAQKKSPVSLEYMIAQEETVFAKATVEKTLYIDSAQINECRDSNSSSSESRSLTDSRGRNPSIDFSLHDFKDFNFADTSEELQTEKRNDHKKETTTDKNLVLPLQLPKSPSESWLSRALPSVSSRNSRSYINTGNLGFRSSLVNTKWEAIANSSKLHNKHSALPALTPISEN